MLAQSLPAVQIIFTSKHMLQSNLLSQRHLIFGLSETKIMVYHWSGGHKIQTTLPIIISLKKIKKRKIKEKKRMEN